MNISFAVRDRRLNGTTHQLEIPFQLCGRVQETKVMTEICVAGEQESSTFRYLGFVSASFSAFSFCLWVPWILTGSVFQSKLLEI